jgi:DNA-binding transcriptional regulator YdaS (Cro superfamily)
MAMHDLSSGVTAAIQHFKTRMALAKALGVNRTAISQWTRIPVMRVLKIERLTGIPRHELRPDIYPPPDRSDA